MSRPPRPRALRRIVAPLLLPLAALLSAGCVSFPIHNANLLAGRRFYDKTTFDPVAEQPTLGLSFDTYKLSNGLGFEVGGFWAWDADAIVLQDLGQSKAFGENYEAYLGVRKTFLIRDEPFYPYFGGGLTAMHTKLKLETVDGDVDDSDTTGGIYVHAGIYWNFLGSANLGLDLRRVFASSVDLFGVDTDVDYTQLMMTMGFSF